MFIGEGVYFDAEFKTKGLTLKAAKMGIKDTPSQVKAFVLEKVKQRRRCCDSLEFWMIRIWDNLFLFRCGH
jgi:hypothetical protein